MTDQDKRRPTAVLTFIAGLALGGLAGFAAAQMTGRSAVADPWIDAGLVWERLPGHVAAGPLPQTFAVPDKAYDYGASSAPLGPLLKGEPTLLRLQVEPTAGKVGLALASPDGAALLSGEAALTPKDGKRAVYFRLGPATPPAIIVVRNYDNPGAAGAVVVNSATYAPVSALSAGALSDINRAGVH